MLPLARRTAASFRLRSRLFSLRVHYEGRTLVCPETNCPLCVYERNRIRYYAVADVRTETGLLEIPPTLAEQLQQLAADVNKLYPVGLAVTVNRTKVRATWKIQDHAWHPIDEDNETDAVENAALIFKLSLPGDVRDWGTFKIFAGKAHAGILRKSTIEMESPQIV